MSADKSAEKKEEKDFDVYELPEEAKTKDKDFAVLMNEAGKEFAKLFMNFSATKILTAEISGIAPAVSAGTGGKPRPWGAPAVAG